MRVSPLALVSALAGGMAVAAPVEVYRDGPRFCPREQPAASIALSEPQAIAHARKLVPDDFCGPTRFVAGCDAQVERLNGTWRVYLHQYRRHASQNDWGGLTHSYVILDAVGNCVANIPGTELGANN